MTYYLDNDQTWTDSTGKVLAISDMPADHAQNVYNLLVKGVGNIAAKYSVYLATIPLPDADEAERQVMAAIDDETAAMHANPYQWLIGKPLMQALKWRIDNQPLGNECWCGHSFADHIVPNDDPRPLCVGCTSRPIGSRSMPAGTFHRIERVRPSDDELDANSQGVPYDNAFRQAKLDERRRQAQAIRDQINEDDGLDLPRHSVLDNPITDYEPVPVEEGDEFKVFVVSTGYYSDFRIDSIWVGDRNGAGRRAHLLELKGDWSSEVNEYANDAAPRLDGTLPSEDLEVLIANYRTRVSVDTGAIIDAQAQTKSVRQSQVPPTETTVEHHDPKTATRRGWRHEVEISTTGPVTDLDRIRKSHSERVAIVRAALIEGIPFR